MSSQKLKGKIPDEYPMVLLIPDLDRSPLINTQYKIKKTQCEFDLYELHNWEKQKYLDQSDDLNIWKLFLP